MLKIASLCAFLQGLGFGLPCLYGIWYFMQKKSISQFMGFPTYGNGPFEKFNVHTSTPLLVGFFLVCALECIAGWGLWSGDKGAAVLSMFLIPLEILFYYGFALPFGWPVLAIRIVLLLLSWGLLKP